MFSMLGRFILMLGLLTFGLLAGLFGDWSWAAGIGATDWMAAYLCYRISNRLRPSGVMKIITAPDEGDKADRPSIAA